MATLPQMDYHGGFDTVIDDVLLTLVASTASLVVLTCLPPEKEDNPMWIRTLACSVAVLLSVSSAYPADDEQPLTPEQQQAVDALKALGGNVMPIAQNDDRLDVTLHLADSDVTDEHLALVATLPKVAWLNLAGTKITDAGLAQIAGLTSLEKLHLEKTGITDAGLAHLAGLKSLVYLNVYGTKVSDAGLQHLHGLKNLKKVYVWQTECTPEGINALILAFSPLEVVGALELKPVVVEEPKAEEAKKEEPKKEEAKKEEPKKEEAKKEEPKKEEPKKDDAPKEKTEEKPAA